ncbi:MAG: ABC transporter substrate-binding protein [Spirochaetota bacterium]
MKYICVLVCAIAVFCSAKDMVVTYEHSADAVNALSAYLKSYSTNAATKEVKEANEAVKAKIAAVFDFNLFGEASLGKNWARLTKAEQTLVASKLRTCIEVYGYKRASSFFNRVDAMNVIGTVPVGSADLVIQSGSVKAGDSRVPLTAVYKLEMVGDRRVITDIWYDIVEAPKENERFIKSISGSSKWLVALYRDQFDSILRKERLSGLYKRMDSVIAQYSAY